MTTEAITMTINTYGGYTVAQLREFIRHHYDAEHGGDNIDELTNDSSASVKIVRDLLDAIEPQQDGDLLRPVARWVYNAVRVNLDLLHGICAEHGCPPGEDVSTWLRARLAGVPVPCMCSGLGPCEHRADGSCRRDRAAVPARAAEPVAIYQILTEGGAWLDTTREYYERVKSDPALARVVYAAPQPSAQADAREGLTDTRIIEIGYRHFKPGHNVKAEANFVAAVRDILAAYPRQPAPRAEVTDQDIITACDAHGITLPVEALEATTALVNHFACRAGEASC